MAERRSGLGRGLDALLPAAQEGQLFRMIPLDRVMPNPHQPRAAFDEEALEALAASIEEVGVLQPVVVRPEDESGRFTLVAGERRLRAARRAGLQAIPAVIREGEEPGLLTQALVENLQREDLGPLEEAAAYQQLLEDFGWTHDEIGKRVGKSRTTVTNALRLLQLPAAIQGMLERGEIAAGHARALLGCEDEKFAQHVARRVAEEGWSVRQVEEAIRSRTPARPPSRRTKSATTAARRPAALVELEERLSEHLGTPVQIEYSGEGGRLMIGFRSLDDLERIYRRFSGD